MSRVGRRILTIPNGVTITNDNNHVVVKGPLGELKNSFNSKIIIEISDDKVEVKRPNDTKQMTQLHGTTNALLANMIQGVTVGYKKELKIVGVGYRAALQGNKLNLSLGFSHPVNFEIPEGIKVEVPKPVKIIISGINKEKVGQFAANIRAKREPEPYLGKGVMYVDEHIIRKAGKTVGK